MVQKKPVIEKTFNYRGDIGYRVCVSRENLKFSSLLG
jgi:hypothetical protein